MGSGRFKFITEAIAYTPGLWAALVDACSESEEYDRALFAKNYLQLHILKHMQGKWGDLCMEDREANDEAIRNGGRILSRYEITDTGSFFYVITEADRSATTMLLVGEY